jgi:hypothetical protein
VLRFWVDFLKSVSSTVFKISETLLLLGKNKSNFDQVLKIDWKMRFELGIYKRDFSAFQINFESSRAVVFNDDSLIVLTLKRRFDLIHGSLILARLVLHYLNLSLLSFINLKLKVLLS